MSERSTEVSNEQQLAERKELHKQRLLRYMDEFERFGGVAVNKRLAKKPQNSLLSDCVLY